MRQPPTPDPIEWADLCLAEGNLALAEIIARELQRSAPGHPELLRILAEVARRVGEHAWADASASQAAAGPGAAPVSPAPWAPADTPDPADRFLLIRAWGCGFWSDVDHVLGQLLLAELAGRTPVVHWGTGSLFRRPDRPNGWEVYFQPVSSVRSEELAARGLEVFPAKWAGADVLGPDVNKLEGPDSRMAALYFLNRPEPLAVSDLHTGVFAIRDWIRPGHPRHGLGVDQLYRSLVEQHLRLQPDVEAHIDRVAADTIPPGPAIAVHLRGGDKYIEDAELASTIDQAPARIDAELASRPDAMLLMLTDDETLLARFRARYGDRLCTTDAIRTSDRQGVHIRAGHDPERLGMEVLTDAFLAARCDAFVGIGCSNVSCMVQHLKPWPEGSCSLLGTSLQHKRNWFLHFR